MTGGRAPTHPRHAGNKTKITYHTDLYANKSGSYWCAVYVLFSMPGRDVAVSNGRNSPAEVFHIRSAPECPFSFPSQIISRPDLVRFPTDSWYSVWFIKWMKCCSSNWYPIYGGLVLWITRNLWLPVLRQTLSESSPVPAPFWKFVRLPLAPPEINVTVRGLTAPSSSAGSHHFLGRRSILAVNVKSDRNWWVNDEC